MIAIYNAEHSGLFGGRSSLVRVLPPGDPSPNPPAVKIVLCISVSRGCRGHPQKAISMILGEIGVGGYLSDEDPGRQFQLIVLAARETEPIVQGSAEIIQPSSARVTFKVVFKKICFDEVLIAFPLPRPLFAI